MRCALFAGCYTPVAMNLRGVCLLVAAIAALVVALGCGREAPEERLDRLRLAHDLRPLGSRTVVRDGEPTVVVELLVTNQGADPLSALTVLMRLRGADGLERVGRRVTLDLSGLRPGMAQQVSASLPGMTLGDRDEVTVELETGLPADVLRTLPEYAAVAGGGRS
jgi:hypothetical protein